MKKGWIIAVVVVAVLALYSWSSYNGFVTLNEKVDGAWAQVDSQYQRRFDLIGKMVASVKGNFQQEKEIFGAISEARTRYSGARSTDERVTAATGFESAVSRFLVIAEQYPQLTSGQAVQSLMIELAGTENRISVERMRFNNVVQEYNTKVKKIPGRMFAALFGFDEHLYFKSDVGAEKAVEVDFTK